MRSESSKPALTIRERQIVRHVLRGESNKNIASRLGTSAHTVKNQLTTIYRKVGVPNRILLVAWAYQHPVGLDEEECSAST
jgi:LuxR family transcriptional regulator of csgAB operon